MSDFEGSDLTDLEDETYTQQSSSSQKKKKQKQPGEAYRVRGALRAPRSTTISASSLLEQLHENYIDLDAEYQRDVVWPVSKQIGLIDSLFRNFYIPPVIFSVTESPDGEGKKVCIDGKQRLTSIWRFMEGLIPHKDPFTHEKYFFKDIPDRKEKGHLLPERYRRIFENKQIVCVEYSDMTDSNEREIFQRVQLGMALTPAEKLQAVHSDAGVFLHNLQSEYVNDRLAEHLDWDTGRAADFRCLSTAVFIIDKNLMMSAPGISTIHKWLEDSEGFSDAVADDIRQTFEIFVWLSEDKQCSKCFSLEKEGKKLKVSPLEFVATVILIHQHKEKMTLKQLSEAIRSMRRDIRSVEQDIRLNTRCMRIVMTFIKNLKVTSLKEDPSNPVATVAIKKVFKPKPKFDEDSDDEEDKKPAKKPAAKRKRESSDDEWQPTKATSSQRTSARQSPTKRSPPSALNLDHRTHPTRSESHSASAPSPRPSSAQSSIPPIASPSLPPPSSSSEPRIHPDRLAALRNAKVGIPVPTYQPSQPNGFAGPNDPPYQSPNSQYVPYPPRWPDTSVMRMGASTSVPDVGHISHPSSDVRNGYRDDGRLSSNGAYQSTGGGGGGGGPPYSASQRSFSRDDYEHSRDRGHSGRYSGSGTRFSR